LEKFLLESDFETGGKTSDFRDTPVEYDIVYRIGPQSFSDIQLTGRCKNLATGYVYTCDFGVCLLWKRGGLTTVSSS